MHNFFFLRNIQKSALVSLEEIHLLEELSYSKTMSLHSNSI